MLKFEGEEIKLGKDTSAEGIDHLLAAIQFVANLAKKFNGYQTDGKFGFFEKIQFGFDLASGMEFATQIDDIIAELRDLQDQELADLVQSVGKAFGWDKERVFIFIENILFPMLTVIRQAVLLSTNIPAFFKK
jgi:hypothetical protein